MSSAGEDEPKLARSIDLLPIDFRRLSRLRAQDGAWHLTVNFLDEDQLLVTFEGAALTHRLRTCPRTHDDRIVHAVLLDAHSLEVRRRVDWYLHDQRQYLWPLGPGQMLLRRGESLLQLDRDLNEKPLLEAKGLVWVDVTPDGKQIALEVQSNKTETSDTEKVQKPSYEVRFLDAATLSPLKTLPLNHLEPLKATAGGYADVDLKGAWTWLVRFGPPSQRRLAVTRVRSTCIPNVEISSESSLLVGRCTPAQDRYVMSSFTTAGQFLWRQQWLGQPMNAPVLTRSASGARFALSTVTVTEKGVASSTDEDDRPEVRVQSIELFNTATGTSALRIQTQPAVTVGGNFALSPEGTTLAVLRDARLELYEVPALGKEEEAKLAAARAGTPGLIPPPSTADPAEDATLADDDDTPAMQPAVAAPGLQTHSAAASNTGSPGASQTASAPHGDASEQSPRNPVATFRSSAQAVVVDVVVTDSKGHTVTGLKPEDFTLTEEGSVQKISFFTEHSVVDTRQSPPPEYKHPPNIFSNVSNTAQPDSATMILFDMLNTPVQDQAHEREALTRYIKSKPKNESFALCVLAGPLRLIRGFTTDENELLLGLLDKRARPSASLISQLDNASLNFIRTAAQNFQNTNDLSQAFSVAAAGVERSLRDEQLSQDDMRIYMTIAAFDQLARYMAGVPGRKKVLWLSAAFPLGRFASPDGQLDAGPFHQERTFGRLVSETVNLLASAHVSVYPVEVRGVTNNTLYNAGATMPFRQNLPVSPLTTPFGTGQQIQAGGGGSGGGNAALNLANTHAAPNNAFVTQNAEDSARRNSEHTTMDVVAEQTGGKAFYGSNDITDALRASVEQGADYYTLSYTPSNRNYDGRFRKLHIKVAERNYRVAHRSGYYAEDPRRLPANSEAVLRSLTAAGMMHGSPESRQIPFQVRIVPVAEPKTVNVAEAGIRGSKDVKNAPTTVKLQHYNVDFAISAAPLRFDSGPEGNLHGSFRLMANSFDSEGRALLQAASTAVADVQPSSYQKILSDGLRLRQELDVPANAGFLRLGVRDLATSYVGTLELPLPIPAVKDDPLARREKALPPVEPE